MTRRSMTRSELLDEATRIIWYDLDRRRHRMIAALSADPEVRRKGESVIEAIRSIFAEMQANPDECAFHLPPNYVHM